MQSTSENELEYLAKTGMYTPETMLLTFNTTVKAVVVPASLLIIDNCLVTGDAFP
jgi:hypothetical protein